MGSTVAALGPFIPLDSGLKCISKEVPSVIQGALFSSAFFHFMVNDVEGVIGITLRAVIGDWSESHVRGFIALLWIIDALAELHLGGVSLSCRPFEVILTGIADSVCMPEIQRAAHNALLLLCVWSPFSASSLCCCNTDSNSSNSIEDKCTINSLVASTDSTSGKSERSLKSVYFYMYWMCVLYVRFALVIAVVVTLRNNFMQR